MNEMRTDTRQILGTFFRDPVGEEENRPQIALESDEDRAIDLSCRACGAMAMGAGLGFPVGDSAPLRFHPQPPTFNTGRATRGAGWRGCTERAETTYFRTRMRAPKVALARPGILWSGGPLWGGERPPTVH